MQQRRTHVDRDVSYGCTLALPQASSCVPFGFQKINLLAASAQSSMTASWLNPIPRWRSPRQRRQVAGHGSRRAPHVDDDEIVTVGTLACIFRNLSGIASL
jgi:hypothetical protein